MSPMPSKQLTDVPPEHHRPRQEEWPRIPVDELTGLHDRRGFTTLAEERLRLARRWRQRLLLLIARIDGLEGAGVSLGRGTGDQAATDVADVFTEIARDSDLVARLDGDEIALLLTEEVEGDWGVVLDRIDERLRHRCATRGRPSSLSLSVGISRFDPDHPCSLDELVAQANRAMREARRVGRERDGRG